MMNFLLEKWPELLIKVGEHFLVSIIALAAGIIIAVPLGIALTRTPKLSKLVFGIVSILQTIPSLALLAVMIPIVGVGKTPAILALFVYSLLPILRNTASGMNNVDSGVLDAARGMGMKFGEIIRHVQLPLASPVIMAGIRLSAVYVVAWATLAGYVGGGGLGDYIFTGLNIYNVNYIIWGTIPVTLLALLTDFIFQKLEEKVQPKLRSKEVEVV